MERSVQIWLDLAGTAVEVGTLWARVRTGKESASFEYEPAWLRRPGAFALDPELPLAAGRFHTDRALFNAFTDPAPDRWGQTLLRRNERVRARREGRAPRTLFSVDFLTLVDDETRLGAVRVREPDGTFLTTAPGARVPPLVQLGRLVTAAARVAADEDGADDIALLLAPGTSLGGARPKASIRDRDGTLAIAKFPRRDDDWPVTRWEAVSLELADAAGVEVPVHRLELVARRAVLVSRRFDRRSDGTRIPVMSALTALAASDGETRSYLELADVLRSSGSRVTRDLEQLWRRIVFNILISNTDDHLRNHLFMRDDVGWHLAPAFDLNPVPTDVRPRVHALAIDETDQTASLERARSVAQYFGLTSRQAAEIARAVATAVRAWRRVAARHGITARQNERMASAFEHDDLAAAR